MHQYCSPCDRPLPAGLPDAMIIQCEYCSLPVAARFPLQRAPHRANLLQIAVKRVQEVIWNQAVVNETSLFARDQAGIFENREMLRDGHGATPALHKITQQSACAS